MAIVGKVRFGVVWLNCGLSARPGMHRRWSFGWASPRYSGIFSSRMPYMYGFRSVSADWIHVRPPISDSVLIHVLPRNGRRASSVGIPPFLTVLYSRVRGSRGTGSMFEPRFRFWVRSMPCCGMTDGLHLLVFRRFPMSGILAHTGLCPVLRAGFMFGRRFRIWSWRMS